MFTMQLAHLRGYITIFRCASWLFLTSADAAQKAPGEYGSDTGQGRNADSDTNTDRCAS
jgi:hypothetical protein